MGVQFDSQLPDTPYAARLRLTCDICQRELMAIQVPLNTPVEYTDSQQILSRAVRFAQAQGWRWDAPNQLNQIIYCRECATQQFRRDITDRSPSREGTVSNMDAADFINQGVQPNDVVRANLPEIQLPFRIVTDPGLPRGTVRLAGSTLITHPGDEERYREELTRMSQLAESDPDFRVFIPGAVAGAEMNLNRDVFNRDVFSRGVMAQFPEPETPVNMGDVEVPWDGSEPAVESREGIILDRHGRPRVTDPWSVDLPGPGPHRVGLDTAIGEDECVAHVIIDGKPTGQTVKLRRPSAGPARRSKWDRLMDEDDDG